MFRWRMNDFSYIDNLSGAYAESRILHAAVELNLFDTIGEKRMSVQEISERLKTNVRATELFLNALTALNLVHKNDNLFSLTDPAKKYLVTTSKSCYTGMIRFESAMWSVWGELVKAIRTGQHIRTPAMYQITRKVLAKEGMGKRIRLIAGDYHNDPLPHGFDVVLLSNIIHGEDEEANKTLLKRIYGSLNPGGRVIIKDHIMNEDLTKPSCGAIFSICMLLTTKGRDYGYHEVHNWLKEAGFEDNTLEELPPPMTSAMVSGRKTWRKAVTGPR